MTQQGRKFDGGKLEYGLLPPAALEATGRALSLLGGELSPSKKRASASEMSKRGRVLLANAQHAFAEGNLEELRELYTEAKESSVDPVIVQQILTLGSQLSQKEKTSAGKEQTTEVQA